MASDDTLPSESDLKDEKIVKEAKKRFRIASDWEADARRNFINDYKFANGDSENMYQWPGGVQTTRGVGSNDERPCLTINDTRQHNLQIINDARQNKPSVSVKPVANEATYEAAQIFEGIVRHIEYISNAQSAYDTATSYQVQAGWGYWRVVTDYSDSDTLDQEIFIRRVKDPLTIYLDPNINEADGSDASFAIIFDDMPKDEFDAQYPKYKDIASTHPLNVNYTDDGWFGEDKVRVAEYYRRVEEDDRLIAVTHPDTGEQIMTLASKLPKAMLDPIMEDPSTKWRTVSTPKIEWFLIIGNQIAERNVWPGKYIPICRVIGEETIIDGQLDRKGHTRAMKDPQRMKNYWFSAAVEHVALQSKTPYVGPMEAFSNLETYWDTANNINHAWLPYNGYNDAGQPLQAPARQAPPIMASAYIQGLSIAAEEMRSVSGQFQSEMGMPSNERSGIAIQQRQRQGDNATYHFIDNLSLAIRFTGKILIDLIPKVYDTQRVIRIMGEDGVETQVEVNPQAQQAYLEQRSELNDTIKAIFNPNVGKYDVEADIGPAYATKRQEAFNAFMEISRGNPDIMKIAGDLMFRAADFPMADKLAERIRRTIPDSITGEAPPPEVQQMMQQMQQMQQALEQQQKMLEAATEALADEKKGKTLEAVGKEVDIYKAETERLKVLAPAIDPKYIAELTAQLVLQSMQTNPLNSVPQEAPPAMPMPEPDQGAMPSDQGQEAPPQDGGMQQPNVAPEPDQDPTQQDQGPIPGMAQ